MNSQIVYLNNKRIVLDQNSFIAEGGEGRIFAKDNKAFKIYLDVNNLISENKIKELSVLNNENIIKPEQYVLNEKKKPIGYIMKLLPDSYSLCQIFPKVFRLRNNLSFDQIINLVRKFQKLVEQVHQHKILIVDLNEMNVLIDKKFQDLFLIDTDSWQTPSFSATAIMDSIRDWHSKSFSELTDWFSFAVLTCQMFTSIHPFKGSYPSIQSWKDKMLQNISIFHPQVTLPAASYPINNIPENYRNWYSALFHQGKRLLPPDSLIAQTNIISPVIINSIINALITISWKKFDSEILDLINLNNEFVVKLKNEYWLSENKSIYQIKYNYILWKYQNRLLEVSLEKDNFNIVDTVSKDIVCQHDLLAEEFHIFNDQIYVKQYDKILRLTFLANGPKLILSTEVVLNVLPKATKFGKNCLVQDIFGSCIINLFAENNKLITTKLPLLDKKRILDLSYQDRVLIVAYLDKNRYNHLIFRFDENFSNYDSRVIEDLDNYNINFAVIKKRIVVYQTKNKLQVFRNIVNDNEMKEIIDPSIDDDLRLFNYQDNLYAFRNKEILALKMR